MASLDFCPTHLPDPRDDRARSALGSLDCQTYTLDSSSFYLCLLRAWGLSIPPPQAPLPRPCRWLGAQRYFSLEWLIRVPLPAATMPSEQGFTFQGPDKAILLSSLLPSRVPSVHPAERAQTLSL